MTGIDVPENAVVADGRPAAPGVAALAAVAAAIVGAAAVAVYGWTSAEGWRTLIAVAMIVAGVSIARPADDTDVRRTWVLGRWVLAGIGSAGVILGAYLAGVALVALSIPDGPFFFGEQPDLPPVVVILLLLYGIPLIALAALAVLGHAAGLVGAGVVAPVLAVSILAAAGASASVIAITALVVAVGSVPLAVAAAGLWGRLAILIGAMAASFAVGAGLSPVGTLTTTTAQPDAETTEAATATGTLPAGLVPVVLAGSLAAAAVLLTIAVSRRDAAGGLVSAGVFAVPPAFLLIPQGFGGEASTTPGTIALLAVPLVGLLIALAAWRAPAVRDAVSRALRLPGTHPAGFAAAGGVAAVVLVVQGLPTLDWPARVSGVVALVVLAAAAVLAGWLPGTAGAVLAGVTLVGLHLAAPWPGLINGDPDPLVGIEEGRLPEAVGLVVAVLAAVVLIFRHSRAGVWAAGAYLLAGAMANVLFTLLIAESDSFLAEDNFEPVFILLLPLLVLGIPAAIAALRGSPAGQTTGAVLVAAAAFIPLRQLITELPSGGAPNDEIALQLALVPFTPTDTQATSRLLEPGPPTLLGIAAMLLLSLVLLASTARRPSAPVTAAVTFGVVIATQAAIIGALEAWGIDGAERGLWALGGLAAVLVAAAVLATVATGNRRDEHVASEP